MQFKRLNIKNIWIAVAIGIVGSFAGAFAGLGTDAPSTKKIVVKARQYAYDPPKIEANLGDTLILELASMDVVHGFYLEGYDIDAEIYPGINTFKIRKPSKGYNWETTDELVVIVNKRGKFRYRCSHTCGTMHPFMQGELIVKPNTPFHAGLGGLAGFAIGLFLAMSLGSQELKIINKLQFSGNER